MGGFADIDSYNLRVIKPKDVRLSILKAISNGWIPQDKADCRTYYLVGKELIENGGFAVPEIELTNMCMIYDKTNNKVLVQERTKSWKGISFPGGHVEDGESIVESTIREIKEETGLTISNLKACGVIYLYNEENQDRYFVFNFKTDTYSGELIDETDEGKVYWVDVEKLPHMNLSSGLKERLPMFFEEKYIEGFGTWNKNGNSDLKLF